MVNKDSIQVDIIVVNWNGRDYLKKAITPLLKATSDYIKINVVVSDNGSTDDSLNQIKDLPVSIIQNGSNIGFGAACNTALQSCHGQYILLLNPDTESSLSTIEQLVRKIEQMSEIGIIGPRQNDESEVIQKTCGRFPIFITSVWELTGLSKVFPKIFTPAPIMLDWDHSTSAVVDQVMGSYMLIKRSIINKLGFMDENFFVYGEDRDFSKRAFDAGFKSYYFHEVEIFHESGGLSKRIKSKRLYFSLSSNFYYWSKHLSKVSSIILKLLALTLEPLIRIINALLIFKPKNIPEICKAYFYLYKEVLLGLKTK